MENLGEYLEGGKEGFFLLLKMVLPIFAFFAGATISEKCSGKKWKGYFFALVMATVGTWIFGAGSSVVRSGGDKLFDAGEIEEVIERTPRDQRISTGRFFVLILIPAIVGLHISADNRIPSPDES